MKYSDLTILLNYSLQITPTSNFATMETFVKAYQEFFFFFKLFIEQQKMFLILIEL